MLTPDAMTKAMARLKGGGGFDVGAAERAAREFNGVPARAAPPQPAAGTTATMAIDRSDPLLTAYLSKGGLGGAASAGPMGTNVGPMPPPPGATVKPPAPRPASGYSPYGAGDPRQGMSPPAGPQQRAPYQATRGLGQLPPPPGNAAGAGLFAGPMGPRRGRAVNQSGRQFGPDGRVLY